MVAMTAGAVLAAGCSGSDGDAVSIPAKDADARMKKVADAWDGSQAARQWRGGVYLLEDAIQLPQDAFRSEQDKEAYRNKWLELRGSLPDGTPPASVHWADGSTTATPVLTAPQTFALLGARSSEKGAPPLVVTGADRGERTVLTSRGPARLPVWRFSVKGYATPLTRVAIPSPELPASPVGVLPRAGGLMPIMGIGAVSSEGYLLTVDTGYGACAKGVDVRVRESRDSVVLAAVERKGTFKGICDASLKVAKVTVRLKEPLAGRVPVNADSGAALPYLPRMD
ncbi:hypothetical protein [Streptomyces sp. CBMA152]|uniref:hypothetical protein n=1 Tax=Streptomyces sp. CBMA152 TaxID=1896312 RepID=UPI001660FBA0|nr:hypothetical protein [Streptomyces sp. CBMA152]